MEAELRSNMVSARAPSVAALRVGDDWREVVFTVAQARRALPYVARIAQDAAHAFNTVQRCRQLLERAPSRTGRTTLCEHRDQAIQRLDQAIDECNLVGAHLFDLATGSVGFHSEVEGRLTCLLWRLQEPMYQAWRDLPSD